MTTDVLARIVEVNEEVGLAPGLFGFGYRIGPKIGIGFGKHDAWIQSDRASFARPNGRAEL
jgi:hypothetical protein